MGFLVQSPVGHSRMSLTCGYLFPSAATTNQQVTRAYGFKPPIGH
jgi:hypothetical protein